MNRNQKKHKAQAEAFCWGCILMLVLIFLFT